MYRYSPKVSTSDFPPPPISHTATLDHSLNWKPPLPFPFHSIPFPSFPLNRIFLRVHFELRKSIDQWPRLSGPRAWSKRYRDDERRGRGSLLSAEGDSISIHTAKVETASGRARQQTQYIVVEDCSAGMVVEEEELFSESDGFPFYIPYHQRYPAEVPRPKATPRSRTRPRRSICHHHASVSSCCFCFCG